jgi:hypothetical protein
MIKLGLIFVASSVMMMSFQNCSQNSFQQNKNGQSDKLSSFAESDAKLVEDAERKLKEAHLSALKFLSVLEGFEKLSKDMTDFSTAPLEKKEDIESPQNYISSLYRATNFMAKIFKSLDVIPVLNAKERLALQDSLDLYRSVVQQKPSIMIVKSICILIEVKGILVDIISDQQNISISSAERKVLMAQKLLILQSRLQEFRDAMVIARPSDSASIKQFVDGFVKFSEVVIQRGAGSSLSGSPSPDSSSESDPMNQGVPPDSSNVPIPQEIVNQFQDLIQTLTPEQIQALQDVQKNFNN